MEGESEDNAFYANGVCENSTPQEHLQKQNHIKLHDAIVCNQKHIKEEKEDMKEDVKGDMKQDVKQDVKEDIKQGVTGDIKGEVKGLKVDVKADNDRNEMKVDVRMKEEMCRENETPHAAEHQLSGGHRSGLSSPTDDSIADEPRPEATPAELTQEGLGHMRKEEYTLALDRLSWALELQLTEVCGEECHPSLGPYYLNYGNCLQQKEEASNDLFNFSQQSQQPSTDAGNEDVCFAGNPNDVRCGVSDEQLAWENLEMARLTMTKALRELEDPHAAASSSDQYSHSTDNTSTTSGFLTSADGCVAVPRSLILDLSFAHIRLGDINMLQEQYEAAAEEFQTAIALREKYQLPYTMLESPLISLGQAHQFSFAAEASLACYERALGLVNDHINGVGGFSLVDDPEKLSDYKLTAEDLSLQIREIKTGIENGSFEKAKEERQKLREANAKANASIAQEAEGPRSSNDTAEGNSSSSSNAFGPPCLSDMPVVDIGIVSSSKGKEEFYGDAKSSKKRRIELQKK